MIKKLPICISMAVFLSLFVFVVQAQLDNSLIIDRDIGQYKYFSPGGYPSQPGPDMKRIGVAMYNWTEQNGDIFGVGFFIIETHKLADAEIFLNKIKTGAPSQDSIVKKVYKDKSLYFLSGGFEGSHAWLWQSGTYIIFGVGPFNPPQNIRQNIRSVSEVPFPEEILDAYLAKYTVNYFECPKLYYTQEMPPDGYQYVPDYDENRCENGRHEEPIPSTTPVGCVPDQKAICTAEYDPVCGENGQTYSNSCLARASCAGIMHSGPCGQDEFSTPTPQITTSVSGPIPVPVRPPEFVGGFGPGSGFAISQPRPIEVKPSGSCADSDGGYDIYKKGTVNGYQDETYSNYWTRTDACNSPLGGSKFTGDSYQGEGVVEHSCMENNVILAPYIKCPEGFFCQDGACTDIKGTALECNDPDRGDYFTRGITCGHPRYPALDPMNCVIDRCEGDTVIEYILMEPDCVVGNRPYLCPSGCVDGACVPVENRKPQPISGISGRVIEKPVEEGNTERLIQSALRLESIRISLQNLKESLKRVSEYYRSIGNEDKYAKWSTVSEMFDTALNKANDIVQYIKSTKDVEGSKTKLSELRSYMSTVADKILESL